MATPGDGEETCPGTNSTGSGINIAINYNGTAAADSEETSKQMNNIFNVCNTPCANQGKTIGKSLYRVGQ